MSRYPLTLKIQYLEHQYLKINHNHLIMFPWIKAGYGGMAGASRDNYIFNKGKEQDSLDKLSLSMIPLSSTALRNARLIKNTRMETTVELMNDPVAGSLQMRPDDIAENITNSTRDRAIIRALAALNSYDVYSLRGSLKRIGVEVEDEKKLDLTDEMKLTLHQYMMAFTRPLVDRIFGYEQAQGHEDINLLLNDPDIARVRDNLRIMSEKKAFHSKKFHASLRRTVMFSCLLRITATVSKALATRLNVSCNGLVNCSKAVMSKHRRAWSMPAAIPKISFIS